MSTYIKIATVTVPIGGAASMDFNSISAAYTDLKVIVSGRTTRTDFVDFCKIQFNGLSTNQNQKVVRGSGTGAGSYSDTLIYSPTNGDTSTASTFGNTEFYIPNYASSNNKGVSAEGVSENNAASAFAELAAGLWSTSAVITSISLIGYYGNWKQYSSATLYGIKNS